MNYEKDNCIVDDGGFLVFSGNSLFADAFDDCFELERLKAKSDGLGAVAAAEQANKVCKAKLGGSQSQGNTTQNNNLADDSKSGGFASIGVLSGVAIKGGYKFKNGRIHYTNHAAPLNDDDFKTVTAGILGFDYIANGGFMIGIGTGNATSPDAQEADFTNCNISSSFNKNYSSSTSATSFNIGWLKNKKGFQYVNLKAVLLLLSFIYQIRIFYLHSFLAMAKIIFSKLSV